VTAPRGDVHEGFFEGGGFGAGWGVLVELVHEDDQLVHVEAPALGEFPDLGDDARDDEVLRYPGEPGDVHHAHLAVLERAIRARQIPVLHPPVRQQAAALVR
jgi:hypothetical protein